MKIASLILNTFSNDKYAENYSQNIEDLLKNLNVTLLENNILKNDHFIENIHELSKNYDYVILAHSDSPFYCLEENKRLLNNTIQYKSDYSFSDNHPKGVVFEILNTKALPIMNNMRIKYNIPVTREVFYNIIEKDINMFDLENIYTQFPIRTLRLSFFQNNQQDTEIVENLKHLLTQKKYTYNKDYHYNDLSKLIMDHRQLLKVTPKYFEIEITHQKTHFSILSPYTNPLKKDMTFDDFVTIVNKIKQISHDPVIAIVGLEEPSANPDMLSMIDYLIDNKIKCILETTTASLIHKDIDKLINMSTHYLSLILLIDSIDKDIYQQIRKTDVDFNIILNNITSILLRRKKNTYIQAFKLDINFEHFNAFHNYFKQYTDNIIIQKYNHYCGILPERRMNPMKPIEKIDCWHLKREMYIQPDGTLIMCKQDVLAQNKIGNLLLEDIETLHTKSKKKYTEHLSDKCSLCKKCDENYTYNF